MSPKPKAKRKPQRDRNISVLPNGRVELRIMIAGRPIKRILDSVDQAKRVRDQLRLDAALRKEGLPGITKRRPRLLEILGDFLDSPHLKELAPATADHYKYCLAGFKIFLRDQLRDEGLEAVDFTDHLVAQYLNWRRGRRISAKARKAASEVQVSKDLTILAMVYRHARVEQPWRMPRKIQRNLGGKRVLEIEAFVKFLEAMPEGSIERTFAECAANTGMRPVDIRKLRWQDLDFEAGEIRFTAVKTRKRQELPMTETLTTHLRAWQTSGDRVPSTADLVFTIGGRELGKTTLRTAFRKASKAAGIEPPIEHIGLTRNMVLSYLLSNAEEPYLVAFIAGHSDLKTTMGYAKKHRALAASRGLVKKLDAVRKAPDPLGAGIGPAR